MNKKKGGKKMNSTLDRDMSPSESLRQSLKEMKLIRQGKMQAKSWRELRKELKDEK
ncbi:hypothetical protein G9G63_09905 [Paenibacillus sp. EKM202P]|uniref:hypothetical protein n=1 Tax=unclassified Paenibacillus TaxID=185978 RepID=UPI0013EE14EC|nr:MULTISPECIES: hypothetical protein [unclassified Paenibacillus]KAF6565461.1 hypothetical protein G9G63_09905 [Paenibacillus sp. EKM202P]KAF6569214.1 hypothetical protein G9G64_12190 [Paenibacillus sp. EKM207P]